VSCRIPMYAASSNGDFFVTPLTSSSATTSSTLAMTTFFASISPYSAPALMKASVQADLPDAGGPYARIATGRLTPFTASHRFLASGCILRAYARRHREGSARVVYNCEGSLL